MPESKGQVITTEPIGMDSEKRNYWHFGGMLYVSCFVMRDLTSYIPRFTMAMERKGKVEDRMSMGNR